MDNTIYKNRRNNLKELLPNNSVLLIPGADLQYRNADSAFPFRQNSSFYYLSGFCEPSSLIAIVNNKDGIKSIIFPLCPLLWVNCGKLSMLCSLHDKQ